MSGIAVKNGIVIPESELEIATSRAGGAGGQHVNKSDTRVTLRWNVKNSQALTDEQKERVLKNLASKLTQDGDLIIHASASRSQQQNKKQAYEVLAQEVRKGLYVPKIRKKTKVTKAAKEARLQSKKQRGAIKQQRRVRFDE